MALNRTAAAIRSLLGIKGRDGSGIASVANPVPVEVENSVAVTGPLTDTQLRATPVPVSGAVTTTGTVTEANSAAIKTSVELIDDAIYTDGTGTPSKAIGVAGTDGTNPQIIKTDAAGELQVDVLTLPITQPLTDTQLRATAVPVSGTVAVSSVGGTVAVSGPLTDTQLRATPVPVSGAVTTSGTVTEANSAAIAASLSVMDDWDESDRAKVNPIVGQAGVEAGAGASTVKTQRVAIATDANTVNTGLTQPLTDTQLRATAVPISGTVTATGPLTNTQLRATAVPISNTALSVVGTGAAATAQRVHLSDESLAALETITVTTPVEQDVDLIKVGGAAIALGQALAAASLPVVLTDAQQTALTPPAAITNFANETGGNLASIKAKTDNIPPLGQALAAASTPVVLTAAQQTALTPPAAITGYNLEATQLLVKAKTDNIPAQGQALAAASLPVVLTAAQVSTLTPYTGGLTETQLRTVIPDLAGTWGYSAGTAGTVILSGSKRVLSITAITTASAGSFTINGGDTITVPANSSIAIAPIGNLTDPTIVFSATAGYFVEVVA